MAVELIYTSVERGLKPGTRGFCTVAHTKGMLPQTLQLLEALSAYKNLYGVHDAQAVEPVAWSHQVNTLAGRGTSVVSRVGASGADPTGRTNKLAHHVLISQREQVQGGPAWLSQQPDFFLENWKEEPHLIEHPKMVPQGDYAQCRGTAWEALTGDAGNASLLASLFVTRSDAIIYILYNPGTDMLSLLSESISLLSPSLRWKVTYNTYFSSLAVGATCNWRCCIADSETAREARRNPRNILLDLTGPLPPITDLRLAELARSGKLPEQESAAPVSEPPASPKKFIVMSNRNINMLNLKPRKND